MPLNKSDYNSHSKQFQIALYICFAKGTSYMLHISLPINLRLIADIIITCLHHHILLKIRIKSTGCFRKFFYVW